MKTIFLILIFLSTIFSVLGCGNADMRELNHNGGTITLYNNTGGVIGSWETDGKPELSENTIYFQEQSTKRFWHVSGTFVFKERM